MSELAYRFPHNPILTPNQVKPSRPDWKVECLLNPGVFRHQGRTGLLMRVAERPPEESGWVCTPILDPASEGGVRLFRCRTSDPKLKSTDPRIFQYEDACFLTTLSHLRLAWSDDGEHFVADDQPTLIGRGPYETFGVEDCRVTWLEDRFLLTYTAVSNLGAAVGMSSTTDWRHFEPPCVLFPPHNKDCAIFPRRVQGQYWALHRPSGVGLGGNNIWLAHSPDLQFWGGHRCIAVTRPGQWDSERIGAGAAPIETPKGWLSIYHGADFQSRYCLGLLLLDLENPTRVVARSEQPVMEPTTPYELQGFFGKVVFTNGHVVDGDQVTVYYGAADSIVCGARFSISELLRSLGV
jgi:predicted GH43/DUF377 family glycosyl hydrolase